LPPGAVIVKAYLIVKKSERQDDDQALIKKEITTAETADGRITDNNTDDGKLAMYFNPSKAETAEAEPDVEYFHHIRVEESNGLEHTLEKGTIPFMRR
jgi:hypothetical protein